MIERLVASAQRRPRATILVWTLLAVGFGLVASRLRADNSLDAYRVAGHVAERDYRRLRAIFPARDTLVVAVRPPRPTLHDWRRTKHRLQARGESHVIF